LTFKYLGGVTVPEPPALHHPANPVRVVTAASLFDGHDASINIMRRILQAQGAEVIHLGHNRSVADVVKAVVEEDAHAVAVSSYQGGHVEYFEYLVERLADEGAGATRVYGGGGGVIVQDEIDHLARAGVTVFSPADGQRLGLAAMVNSIIADSDAPRARRRTWTTCSPVRPAGWLAPSAPSSSASSRPRSGRCWRQRRRPARSRCSASPVPAGRASRR
jgi:methylmalonyl-CoA mutase